MIKRFLSFTISITMCFLALFTFSGCINTQKFTVTFDANGGERVGGGSLVQLVTEVSQIVAPTLEKDGYVFNGWDTDLSKINTDTTITAIWKKAKFVVNFVVNGGVKAPDSAEDCQSVTSAQDLVAPTYVREGYDLVWDIDIQTINKSCTVKGSWIAKKYNLLFRDLNDNVIDGIADKEVVYDQSIGALDLGKIINGQKIIGWKIKDTQENLISGQNWTYTSDKTAVPIMANLSTYFIDYNLDNGEHQGNPISYEEGHDGFTINNPTKKGHIFIGWQEKDELGNDIGEPTKNMVIQKGSTGDKYYVAIWKAKTYSVTLITDYGTFVSGQSTKEKAVQINYGDTVNFDQVLDAPNDFKYWENSSCKLENGVNWELDESDTYTFKAVFVKRYAFNLIMECTVRNKTVVSKLNDQNTQTRFYRTEDQVMGNLPAYTPLDTQEYSASNWKYFNGEKYVSITENTVVNDTTFNYYIDDNLDGIIEVDLYAWCRANWTPEYPPII